MKYLLILLFLFNSHLFAQENNNKDNESMMSGVLKTALESLTDIYKSEKKSEDEEKN